jgi:hypothetical protein
VAHDAINRLADASSAYLRSAAHQPVHWHPWSDEAFAAARAADRPVLLDVGAVWCHWCHVMDHESYEDPSLAEFLNQRFVCVKVDRDERPDVDGRYQRAVQALTGQGGWPLTAILTPDGEVFFGGTYFPPDGRQGRPGFRTMLERVLEVWRDRRGDAMDQARALRRLVEAGLDESMPGEPHAALLESAVGSMRRSFDAAHGGFGSRPKFPHPGAVALLLTRWADTADPELHRIVERTLIGMARGGIHDQIGGGFHRYSVDAEWVVPHFEKMASDNAELLRAYADAAAALADDELAAAARGIVRWVRDVLADPDGGYGASQDADVGPDDDGDYFTWSRAEAAAVLDPEQLEVAAAHWDIGTAGEMHHDPSRNVLFIDATAAALARRMNRGEGEIAAIIDTARAALRAARERRPAPFVDRTRYTSWNAMLAGALLRAAPVLGDEWARGHALRTLDRIRREAPAPDALAHRPGGATGLLEDQVHTASAALDAFEATGDDDWLGWAAAITDRIWRDYWDHDRGGLFDTAHGRGGEGLLPTRAKPIQDAPGPSGNGTAGVVLMRLHALTGQAAWRDRAGELLRAFAGRAAELGVHGAAWLQALDWHLHPATEIVIVGEPGDARARRMHEMALAAYAPRRTVRRVTPGSPADALPAAMRGMLAAAGGDARGYLCRGAACSAPASDEASWAVTLNAGTP